MARLKGGSHVAGTLTVEGLVTVGGIQLDVDKTLIFSANANLTQNKIVKSDQFNEVIDSRITDAGGLNPITLEYNSQVSGNLVATGQVYGASLYLEEDGNSGNYLRILNNSGLTVSRTLSLNIGNVSDRTLTISGDATLVAGTMVPTSRTISTTAPLSGGNTLSGNLTISMLSATALRDGYMTSTYASKLDGIASGAQVNVATNLSWTAGTTAGPVVNSSTGANATIPSASGTASGVVNTTTQSFAGIKTFTNTTDASSTTTGAVKISGGLGVAKDIWGLRVHNAVYNDLAEFMYFSEPSSPGDVIVMTKGGVAKSTKRGQKSVVGVHSDTFGYSLGESDAKKKTPIGLSGRVNVKISEKCKIGDILISDKSGLASVKKWYDFWRTGCTLGKVLEDKTSTNLSRVEMLIK